MAKNLTNFNKKSPDFKAFNHSPFYPSVKDPREVLAQQPGEKDIEEATSRAPVRPVLIGDII
jgi:hypothetical protein